VRVAATSYGIIADDAATLSIVYDESDDGHGPLQPRSRPPQWRFRYMVDVSNLSSTDPIQLVSRKLRFRDYNGNVISVDGEGVVGEQPVIAPNGSHAYSSFVDCLAPYAMMRGSYQLINLTTNQRFDAEIAPLLLVCPEHI